MNRNYTPLRDVVNFGSYLIVLRTGKSRLARGVATVGGRTHIGVTTKEQAPKS
jgi:hypothetical protein